MRLSDEQIQTILLGDRYISIGNPLKDAMDEGEVIDLVHIVACWLREHGYELEGEDEEE